MSARAPWPDPPSERLERRIVIGRDGSITARSGKVEFGQGIRTCFAKIVAEELAVPIEHVRVELGETDRVPWDMGTFGSLSTATDGRSLRLAAAFARTLLLKRAASRLGLDPGALETRGGRVFAPDGRAVSYAELASEGPLAGELPEPAAVRRSAAPALDAPLRLEGLDIVTGRARYVADLRLPGMLRGHVLSPPARGARLARLDDRAARALPGVVAVVRDGDVVGVVAERDEQALAGLAALDAEWEPVASQAAPRADLVLRHDADAEVAFAGRVCEAHYHVPHVAHASIGPSAAVADVRDGEAHLYVATHRPFSVRDEVAQVLGLAHDRVHVHPQMMSGTYGRGNMADAAVDAARLSRGVSRPVLVQWTREEEFRLSPHRPTLDAHLRAALHGNGMIEAWHSEVTTNSHAYGGASAPPAMLAMTSGRNAVPPYRLEKAHVGLHVVPAEIRTGPFRSLAAAPNVFAIESFMDELAHASGQDPVAFRLRHVEDARLRRVLEAARDASGWDHRRRERGRGLGVACAIYHQTYVAQVVEATVGREGQVRVTRVWCAVDPGHVVHPDGARNQIEGGIEQAASWTLLEELRVTDGRVTSASWHDYPIATIRDAPREIHVVFVADESVASSGIGEVGSVPIAAAIANAAFDACGARVRRLPLTPSAVSGARG